MALVCCLRFCVYILCVVCIYCMLLVAHVGAGMQVVFFFVFPIADLLIIVIADRMLLLVHCEVAYVK